MYMEERNEKRVGEAIAKAFGNEPFFAVGVDFEKVGFALNCDPKIVELVNVILNQYGCEYIYEMVEGNQFITIDEVNACGDYTPIPQSFKDLCEKCINIINQALEKCGTDVEDIAEMVTAKLILENHLEETKEKKYSSDLLAFADWVSDCAVDNPRCYGHPEVLIKEWEESTKRRNC